MNSDPHVPLDDPSRRSDLSTGAHHAAQFAPTHWSVVLTAAQSDLPGAAAALAQLCRDYWYPLYAFVRRKGFAAHEAQDLTQDFFARLLDKNLLKAADPARGKFRSFLLSSLQNFLNNEWDRQRAAKRGGQAATFSLDDATAEDRYRLEPAHDLTPERIFERRWALTLLEKVHARLQAECVAEGKGAQFEVLQVYLSGEPGAGNYGESATRLGLTEGAVRVAVHRLRKRLGQLLKKEVGRTVADPKDVDEEIGHLLAALSRS
ncbi:MAG: sigma-70 family RNA polymerase sigma factor [Chloroflexi bacterium]|nr:sigma-70 family RNA polymerase sigma factor [Chloroflexota bacterium]